MKTRIETILKRGKRCRGTNFSLCCAWSWGLVTGNLILLSIFLLDGPVAATIKQHAPLLKPIGSTITDFGKSDWILIGSFVLGLQAIIAYRLSPTLKGRFQAAFVSHLALYVFLCIALSGLCANLLKRIIGRARPTLYDQVGAFGFDSLSGHARFESFPSGHATTVAALMMAMALIAPAGRKLFLVMGLWLGFSRVIVGAHYPSDVIAGLALGAWFSLATAIVFSRYGLLFRQQPNGWPVLRRPVPLSPLAVGFPYRNFGRSMSRGNAAPIPQNANVPAI